MTQKQTDTIQDIADIISEVLADAATNPDVFDYKRAAGQLSAAQMSLLRAYNGVESRTPNTWRGKQNGSKKVNK